MTPRSNLSDFIKERCIEAARAAIGDGGDVEDAIAQRLVDDVLNSPKVRKRIKDAGPQEKAKFDKEFPEFVRELQELGVAPPSLLIPQRPDKMNVEPQAVKAMLHEASAAVIAQADEALAVTAASVGCEPPAQSDLAAWIGAGHCPPETLDEVTKRLAVLWGLAPGQVRVTGWALGGLVTWRDGVELHVPAADLLASARQRNIRNPLGPLVAACPERPTAVEALTGKQKRLFPANLGLVTSQDEADTRTLALLSNIDPSGQLRMPDFPDVDATDGALALPVQLFDLGVGREKSYGNGAAPLALRLFVEALLALKVEDRGRRAVFTVKLRDLLDRLYPNGRPSPARYWPRLREAAELISSNNARIPWYDHERRTGGLWQAVTVRNIPRGPGALDDRVTMEVYLPPTARRGPPVSPNLPAWGMKSARAYRLLLNLPAHWWEEGTTYKPMGEGAPWGMTHDADAYPVTTESGLVRMAHPTSENAHRSKLWARTRDTLEALAKAGEILPIEERSDGLLILPPWIDRKDRAQVT